MHLINKLLSPIFFFIFLAQTTTAQTTGTVASTASADPPLKGLRLLRDAADVTENESARNNISAVLEEHAAFTAADFRANKGQWHSPALFRMDAPQMHIQFLEHAVEFGKTFGSEAGKQIAYLWNWTFINGNRNTSIIPNKEKGGSNFILSPEHTTFITHNGEIWYDQIYYGIDARFYGVAEPNSAESEFLCDFILYPYADPTDIKIAISGCDSWFIDKDNQLVTVFATQTLTRHAPKAYQYIKGQKQLVNIAYLRTDEGYLAYKIGDYKQSLPLIIH